MSTAFTMAEAAGIIASEEQLQEFLRRFCAMQTNGLYDRKALGLSAEAIEARRAFVGGSDIKIIARGKPEDIMSLWRFKRGEEDAKDLSNVFHVALGNVTEPYHLAWINDIWGYPISRMREVAHHPDYDWAACTLDGWVADYRGRGPAVVQCKHTNAFQSIEDTVDMYRVQTVWEMGCTGADIGLLSIIRGTNEPDVREVAFDAFLFGELLEAADRFMRCVKSGVEPVTIPVQAALEKAPYAPPAPRAGETDMGSNNQWADAAGRYKASIGPAKMLEKAQADLKALVPATTERAYGHGVEVKVNKRGAMTVKLMEAEKAATQEGAGK